MLRTSISSSLRVVRTHATAARPTTAPVAARRRLHAYPVLPTAIDTTSPEFKERAQAMKELEDDLVSKLQKIELGGGEKARRKVKEKEGKLLVRER